MKKLVILVVVIVAAVIAVRKFGQWFSVDRPTQDAVQRVQKMIGAMESTPRDEQTALCLWALNRQVLDADTIRAYVNQWEEFWRRSGLGAARGWTISVVEPAKLGITTVVARSGDLEVRMYVPERAQITLTP
ncbi:MAG: hypothetical protein AB2L07_19950 [Thermoanaerobaculaceae bacterium]